MEETHAKQDVFAVATIEAPKVLADIFESVAGAIYRDSGDNIDVLWKICMPLMQIAFQLY